MTLIIGVAGASGSGKSTFARRLLNVFRTSGALLAQDYYYHSLNHLSLDERAQINFDHPKAIDFELMTQHLVSLKMGKTIDHPIYDFTSHTRMTKTVKLDPPKVLIVDGILVLYDKTLSKVLDFKIFIDTPPDLCFIRRLQRDVRERGRSVESVIEQYLTTVRPMYKKFVEPGKLDADMILNGERDPFEQDLSPLRDYLFKIFGKSLIPE